MRYPIGTRLKENEYYDEFDSKIVGYAVLGDDNELRYMVLDDYSEYENQYDLLTQKELDETYTLKRFEDAKAN